MAHAGLCYVRHITLIIKFGGEILGNIVSPGARPKTFQQKGLFFTESRHSIEEGSKKVTFFDMSLKFVGPI